MTVQNTIVKNVYVGNGSTTVFPFTFECNKAEHIQAFVKDAVGNISSTTNFKVNLDQKNVTYPNTGEPLPDGYKLIILRQLPLQQLLNLLNQGPFYAEDIEETFDEVVMMLQQMTERIGRSLAVSIDIDAENSFNTIIPLEAGKTFRVKDDGTGFEVTEDPGKVIDGAKALLKQTTLQAEFAKEQADASSQSAVSAQNAANAAEAVAPEYAKTKEVLDNIVSYTNTATEQASIATAKANAANVSATNAAQSYANADAVATQLTEYLATKETLTAPAVDKTLLIEGAAADSKVVGELKGDFDEVVTKTPVSRNLANPAEYIPNKVMISTGTLADSSSSFVMGAIRVVPGEKIYLTLPRSINCFDTNGKNIQSLYYEANPNTWSNEYTVPDGVSTIVITGYNSRLPYMVNRGTELLPYEEYDDTVLYEVKPSVLPKIDELYEDAVRQFVYEPEYTMSKGYMGTSGIVTESENHKYTSKISVNAGDIVSIISSKKAKIRFLCAFGTDGSVNSTAGSVNHLNSYTVPDGVGSVVLTIENIYDGYYKLMISGEHAVSAEKYVKKVELTDNDISVVKNKIRPKLHDKVIGSVNSETGIRMDTCCCQNRTVVFRGNITNFLDIVIGLGHNGNREIFYKIDNESVKLYTSALGNPVVEVEHGLAISGYICVTINANDLTAKITLTTMSGVFTYETISWIKNSAEVFVETDSGSMLTDCELIFSPNDIRKSIWLFGDSYMSYANNRVLYWLKNLGATNFCINALPGEASDRAMTDLMYMLEYSTPSKIIWNMGMNDGDQNSAVNANWETCFNLLKAICGEKGIELILYTVPSVPTVNNEYKNAVIRDSGYRYIDGASAVGASASGVWYDGMLSSDGVHPNKTGAIAIAQEMILTVPELLLN